MSGTYNNVLEQFFDTAPHSYPIYYTYFHEPEDNIAAGMKGSVSVLYCHKRGIY